MSQRPPNVRKNYLADSQQLIHLARAVLRDLGRPAAWRDRAAAEIEQAARTLMSAPPIESKPEADV